MGKFKEYQDRFGKSEGAPKPPHQAKPGRFGLVHGQKPAEPTGESAALDILAEREAMKGLGQAERQKEKARVVRHFRPEVDAWKEKGGPIDAALLSWFAIFVFDLGDMGEFLELTHLGEENEIHQVAIPKKDWRLLRVYTLLDWCAERQAARESFAPFLVQEYDRLEPRELDPATPGALPPKLIGSLDYFYFYQLLTEAKLEEAVEFGERRLAQGSKAQIKGRVEEAKKTLAGKLDQAWNAKEWAFVASKKGA